MFYTGTTKFSSPLAYGGKSIIEGSVWPAVQ
jgi:hypothetical protein